MGLYPIGFSRQDVLQLVVQMAYKLMSGGVNAYDNHSNEISYEIESFKNQAGGCVNMIRRSMTLVWVGPVLNRSDRRSKNRYELFS